MGLDFSHIMSERTDKELVDIVTLKHNEYTSDALIAAVNELEKRQIDVNAFYSTDQISFIKETADREKENLSLTVVHKTFIVLLPISILISVTYIGDKFFSFQYAGGLGFCLVFIVQWLINRNLRNAGYFKRAAEFKRWVAYTIYIYLGILLLVTLYVLLFGLK